MPVLMSAGRLSTTDSGKFAKIGMEGKHFIRMCVYKIYAKYAYTHKYLSSLRAETVLSHKSLIGKFCLMKISTW